MDIVCNGLDQLSKQHQAVHHVKNTFSQGLEMEGVQNFLFVTKVRASKKSYPLPTQIK